MDWVYKVLERKGMEEQTLERLKKIYKDGVSIVVVNNVEGRKVENKRLSPRQGDRSRMFYFAF